MLDDMEFVRQSINRNIFFARTMREYCANIELAFLAKNQSLNEEAERLAKRYEEIGAQIVPLEQRYHNAVDWQSGIFITEFTLPAEELTEKLFDIQINSDITRRELQASPSTFQTPTREDIELLENANRKTKEINDDLISFCNRIIKEQDDHELFSYSYTSFYEYVIRNAGIYNEVLERLIRHEDVNPTYIARYQHAYNRTLQDSAAFIRGLCDPKHKDIINKANNFCNRYDSLVVAYETTILNPDNQQALTDQSLALAREYKVFVTDILQKLLKEELYFIVEPIFLDNVLTDINFCLYIF